MKPSVSETGTVVRTKDGLALVTIGDVKTCKGCGMAAMGLCRPGGSGEPFWADNRAGAKEGDRVRFAIEGKARKKGFFFMFGLPLLGFLAGSIAGHWLSAVADLAHLDIICGAAALLASVLWGISQIKKLEKKERLYITEIVSETQVFHVPETGAEAADYLSAFGK